MQTVLLRLVTKDGSDRESVALLQVQIWRDWPGQACCTDDETLRGAVISDDWRDERPDMERDGKAAKVSSSSR